jgi:hypothetical protein
MDTCVDLTQAAATADSSLFLAYGSPLSRLSSRQSQTDKGKKKKKTKKKTRKGLVYLLFI